MAVTFVKPGDGPTPQDMQRWREARDNIFVQKKEAHARWLAEDAELDSRLLKYDRLLDAARAFHDDLTAEHPTTREVPRSVAAATAAVSTEDRGETWTSIILKKINAENLGISFSALKESLAGTSFGEKLKTTEKSFYGAIKKLSDNKDITKHNGRLYSPNAFIRFQQEVAAGIRVDEAPPKSNGMSSPVRDAMISFLRIRGFNGANAAEIFAYLAAQPQTKDVVKSKTGKTAVYNLVARCVRRRELVKEGSTYRLANLENEPRTLSGGGSESDGGATPSIERRGVQGRIF